MRTVTAGRRAGTGLLVLLVGTALAAPPTGHVLRSDELRALMKRMDALVYEETYTELDLDLERARQARALAAAADELAGTADAIAESALVLPLDETARTRFTELANQLYNRALAVQSASSGPDLQALRSAFGELEGTCIECHALFRNPIPVVRP
jgi:cytochrome c556